MGDSLVDGENRQGPHLVAFDALRCPGLEQYSEELILRELLKSYVACRGDPLIPDSRSFATGNWGCGVCGGDPQLKSLIQWLAASAASRDMDYFVYGEERMAEAQRVFGML